MPTLVPLELDRDDARIAGLLLRRAAVELDRSLACRQLTPAQRGNRAWYADRARAVSADLLKVGARSLPLEVLTRG